MNRRHAIALLGTAAFPALTSCRRAPELHTFQAIAFGTSIGFQTHGISEKQFAEVSRHTTQRLTEIEALFSLYIPSSTLCILNREGSMENPPAEFLSLIRTALEISAKTQGLFDITVQPLWLWREKWKLADLPERTEMESDGSWENALSLVGHAAVHVGIDRISFQKKGMALTLNAIAQGYATDQIAELLESSGVHNALINIGEYRALGHSPSGKPWNIRIRTKDQLLPARELPAGIGLAVSAGYGHTFEPDGRYNHLFRPKTGSNPGPESTIITTAPTAAEADALATALAVATPQGRKTILRNFPDVKFEELI